MNNSKLKKQGNVFIQRKIIFTLTILSIMALYFMAVNTTNYNFVGGLLSVPRAIYWMIQNLVPTEDSWARLPTIFDRLFETVLVSVAVTVSAATCALLFSLFGTRTLKVNVVINKIVRLIAGVFRAIPEVVWAILLVFSFGQNAFTGFFALFFTTFGLLTRSFIEAIDEVSGDCVEALQATGASNLQIVFQGVIPSSISIVLSWVLYMIETNIRAATLIGLLTGSGIGALFSLYYGRMDWGSAALVVLFTAIVVVIIELGSNQIRKVIL